VLFNVLNEVYYIFFLTSLQLLLHRLLPHPHLHLHPQLQHHHPLLNLSLPLPLKLHLVVEYLQAHLLRRLLRRRALN